MEGDELYGTGAIWSYTLVVYSSTINGVGSKNHQGSFAGSGRYVSTLFSKNSASRCTLDGKSYPISGILMGIRRDNTHFDRCLGFVVGLHLTVVAPKVVSLTLFDVLLITKVGNLGYIYSRNHPSMLCVFWNLTLCTYCSTAFMEFLLFVGGGMSILMGILLSFTLGKQRLTRKP